MSDAHQYNAEDVFDDVAQPAVEVSKDDQANALREVVKQAQRSRLPPPAFSITILSVGPSDAVVGEIEMVDPMDEILGVIGDEESLLFTPVDSPSLPIVQNLYRKFKAAIPAPKIVRVDTDESYQQYLDGQRGPYTAELEQRLADLEAAVADHVSDNHAHGRVANVEQALAEHIMDPNAHHIEVLGAAVEAARERAAVCGDKVPLSLHPESQGKVSCWQSGDQICCSIRAVGPGGPRVLTTATPAARHVDEVVSYAEDTRVDPIAVKDTLPMLAQVLGGGAMVTQLSKMAPEVLGLEKSINGPVVVKAEPQGDPCVAAVMALLQLCDKNKRACVEVEKLRASDKGADLVKKAEAATKKAKKERR